MVKKTSFLQTALERTEVLALPNWRVIFGALFYIVWNQLTGGPKVMG